MAVNGPTKDLRRSRKGRRERRRERRRSPKRRQELRRKRQRRLVPRRALHRFLFQLTATGRPAGRRWYRHRPGGGSLSPRWQQNRRLSSPLRGENRGRTSTSDLEAHTLARTGNLALADTLALAGKTG